MKSTFLYTLFFLAAGAFLFYGNSSGAGSTQGIDRTGSPLSPGSCNASGCHGGNAFGTTIDLVILDGEEVVNSYEPGKAYTMRLTVNTSQGDPQGYGFQAVALNGPNNNNAGAWSMVPDGVQTVTINDRSYVEHSGTSNNKVFEVEWTAPSSNIGAINFYAAGNAVNRNNTSSGDGAMALSEPVVLDQLSAIGPVVELDVDMNIWPNPVADQLTLNISDADPGAYQVSIVDMQGRILVNRPVQLGAGENQERFDVSRLNAGHYFLRLTDGEGVATRKVLKN